MDLHSSPTLSLFSGLSFLSTSLQRSHLQNKFKLPSLPDYSDLHLCSGSVSLCSETSLSLTSLPMLSCQLTLNGRKAELRALHNCFYHQGPATCLSNSTLVQPLWTPPRSRQSLAEFPVTCSADTRLKPPVCTLAFIIVTSLLLWTHEQYQTSKYCSSWSPSCSKSHTKRGGKHIWKITASFHEVEMAPSTHSCFSMKRLLSPATL